MTPDILIAFTAGAVVGYLYAHAGSVVARLWRVVCSRLCPDVD